LSDSQLGESLSVRYDFILFTGFTEWVPDKTTVLLVSPKTN